MNTYADKTSENKSQAAADSLPTLQNKSGPGFQLVDNRPGTIAQRKMQKAMNESSVVKQLKANNTGLPDNLKSGIENLSGISMDSVKVHYNSSKPEQLQAHAYAQGTEIHLAPGQEKHLPHEAWHLVQQAQGRVKPTMQMKGNVKVNDDAGLEKEADVMGGRAVGTKFLSHIKHNNPMVSGLTVRQMFTPTKKEKEQVSQLRITYKDIEDDDFTSLLDTATDIANLLDLLKAKAEMRKAIKKKFLPQSSSSIPASASSSSMPASASSSTVLPSANLLASSPSVSAPKKKKSVGLSEFLASIPSIAPSPLTDYAAITAASSHIAMANASSSSSSSDKPISNHPVICEAYRITSEKGGNKNSGNTKGWNLNTEQVMEILTEWKNLGGTSVAPERRPDMRANGRMLIHLNYEDKSYHAYINETQLGGKKEAAFLKIWGNADKIVVH